MGVVNDPGVVCANVEDVVEEAEVDILVVCCLYILDASLFWSLNGLFFLIVAVV